MIYVIQINAAPHASLASLSALRFARALLDEGHQILRVFFYREGIHCAWRQASPPDDEINLGREWSQLASRYDFDLVVCISAAQRRGLLCDDEARRQGLPEGVLLADGFRIGGLGQWLEASLHADRSITFG